MKTLLAVFFITQLATFITAALASEPSEKSEISKSKKSPKKEDKITVEEKVKSYKYDENGKLLNFGTKYIYDGDDKLLSKTVYDENGELVSKITNSDILNKKSKD